MKKPSSTVSSLNKLNVLKLGDSVRALRTSQKRTLQNLAEKVGVSRSHLSQIESGKVSPSMNTLWSLADALGTSIASLFEGREAQRGLSVDSADVKTASDGTRSHIVFVRGVVDFEVAYMEYSPGSSSGQKPAQHVGNEYYVVLNGEIEVTLGHKTMVLKQDDAIRFSARIPHNTKNIGDQTACAMFIVLPGEG